MLCCRGGGSCVISGRGVMLRNVTWGWAVSD